MKDRFFAFGCSYTNWVYPTWADYVGINFKEYRNLGKPGCSNQHILEKIIETDETYKFRKDDTIYIMLTGIFRFTFCDKNNTWNCNGDLYNYLNYNPKSNLKFFVNYIFNENFAAHQTWVAVHAIKSILESKGINYKIFMGIDNSEYKQESYHFRIKNRIRDVYNLCEIQQSLESWAETNRFKKRLCYKNRDLDLHPHYETYLKYVKEFLPEYYTSKAENLISQVNKNCNFTNQHEQGNDWENLRKQFTIMDT